MMSTHNFTIIIVVVTVIVIIVVIVIMVYQQIPTRHIPIIRDQDNLVCSDLA